LGSRASNQETPNPFQNFENLNGFLVVGFGFWGFWVLGRVQRLTESKTQTKLLSIFENNKGFLFMVWGFVGSKAPGKIPKPVLNLTCNEYHFKPKHKTDKLIK
jgi:hypothetical protein